MIRRNAQSLPLLVLLVAGCSTPAGPGDSRLVTAGQGPGTVTPAGDPLGGVVDMARVRFAGDSLTTDLVGDSAATRADGWTLVVAGGAARYPATVYPLEVAVALPEGPGLTADGTLHCVTRLGAPQALERLPGIPVDLGERLRFTGLSGTLELPLLRRPAALGSAAIDAIRYQLLDRARQPGEVGDGGNWSSGAQVILSSSGGNRPAARDRGSLPFAVDAPESLTLPLAFEGLKIDGEVLADPARDPATGEVVGSSPRFALPTATAPLALSWSTWSTPQPITLSIEYYGAGSGRCPPTCAQGSDCCQSDSDCSSLERCEASSGGTMACVPKDGSSGDALGALICSLPDTGEATVTAGMLEALNQGVPAASVKGTILRIGRTRSAQVTLSDVLTYDGTRQSLAPILVRASDMTITRLTPPGP